MSDRTKSMGKKIGYQGRFKTGKQDLMCGGRLFQSFGAQAEKARSPLFLSHVREYQY